MKDNSLKTIKPIRDGEFVARNDIVFATRYEKTVTVPTGFVSDGATCMDELGFSFFIHDWCYFSGKFDDGSYMSRKQADTIYRDYIQDYAKTFKRRVRGALRFFGLNDLKLGAFAWSNHRARERAMRNSRFI